MKNASQNKIRIIAFLVFILTLIFMFSNFILIPIFLTVDFALRGFNASKFSILSVISSKIVKFLPYAEKPVFFPPKQFAAKIGLVFSISLIIFYFLNLNSIIITSILAFFAAMEAFFNICMGCIVFNKYQEMKIKYSKN
ncbi:DUF4395 domain-containing protein [Halpernia sp. GG3]